MASLTDTQFAEFDVILVNISAGKDSQAMLDVVYRRAERLGVTDRLVTVFCDLGDEDEWQGTRDLAAEHAAHYGIRFEVVARMVTSEVTGAKVSQSLSDHIEERGMWPDQGSRYCTSDMKRDPVQILETRLCRELRESGKVTGRRVRILNCMGLRAEESVKRRLMTDYTPDTRATNKTVREVWTWLPIHSWAVGQVWARIKLAGTRSHWAYDAGMPRLSCRFCILASKPALVRAAQLDPEGAAKRLAMEQRMAEHGAGRANGRNVGSDFRQGLSMAQVIAEAEAATAAGVQVKATNWAA